MLRSCHKENSRCKRKRTFPLGVIDLHRHLDGAFRPESLYKEAKRRNLPQAKFSEQEFIQHCQVSPTCHTLTEFLNVFHFFYDIAQNLDFLAKASYEVVEDCKKDGLIYAELRFAPHLFISNTITVENVLDTVLEAIRKASIENQIPIRVIACVMRGSPVSYVDELVKLFPQYHSEGLVGLDLAGDESKYPGDEYATAFEKAAAEQIPITIHAGEAAGAESVWLAIDKLKAKRIGHGIHSISDHKLLSVLKEKNITLEICLTSNVQTGAVKSLADHPFPEFLRQNVPVTINTDDPSVSGITLSGELELAQKQFHLNKGDLQALQKQAVQAAFCEHSLKQDLLAILSAS
ncbi:MAG: adenosine deaminase [Candidatus Hydrogenedentota bacterium]|nr:MAG: adenosine deaminase [Candidatus Hydrogenedentota bacterium]